MANDHQATERAAKATHQAIDKAAEHLGHAEEGVRAKASDLDKQAREKAEQARQQTDELYYSVRGYVHEHPVAAVSMAFGAGLLVSALLRRR